MSSKPTSPVPNAASEGAGMPIAAPQWELERAAMLVPAPMLAALRVRAQQQGLLAADLLGIALHHYLVDETLKDAGLIDSEGERKHRHNLCERFALQPW